MFGATGKTGRHLTALALKEGHRVRVLVRDPAKLTSTGPGLEVHQGLFPDFPDLDALVHGVDFVVCMLGDVEQQKDHKVNTAFVRDLVPAMRRHGVTRFLYQARGLAGRRTSRCHRCSGRSGRLSHAGTPANTRTTRPL